MMKIYKLFNMKPIKTFIIGSQAFFKDIDNYISKDIDELNIMDEFNLVGNSFHINNFHNKDVFFYKNLTKEEFIEDTLNSSLYMKVGKFLVPEFAKYINLTIKDLKKLIPVIEKIDKKHEYEKIIFYSYIDNNDFYLTNEQKIKAFNKYNEFK